MNGSVLSFRRLVSSLFCQSGIWRAQRPTNVNAVSTGTVYTCGHQAGVTNTHPLAQGITATCPMGSTLVGGGYQLMGSTPLKSSPSGGTNSPDASYPSGGTWYVKAGGYPDFCFRAFAMCAE